MKSKIIFLFAVVFIVATSCYTTPETVFVTAEMKKPKRAESFHMQHDGMDRTYLLYQPENLPAGAPLVFVIHGFTDNARSMMNWTKFNTVADKHGFAVCYPQGGRDDQGRSYWEVGYKFSEHIQKNDVDFLKTLALNLQEEYGFSKENTFVTGMSNGGEMSIMLGLFAPDVFKAIGPVAACIMDKTWKKVETDPAVPVILIQGDSDGTTNWNGDMKDSTGWGAYHSTKDLVALLAGNDPTLKKEVIELPDTDKKDRSTVELTKYTYDNSNREFLFYRVKGGDHDWPGKSGNMDIDASEVIWDFFSKYLK